ncbi:hypothetical protein MEBOL_004795 [Melittangium boletus DSM 14713]|uniref:Uncharacterized protein n=1 Tax=Melittangium boletus DSM 14713 TaxID=1294270 RepID=A0A250IJF9_9BACT|nr:hypothetical protein MEBOL_004795 [Melittangium boletus DSM 14713]
MLDKPGELARLAKTASQLGRVLVKLDLHFIRSLPLSVCTLDCLLKSRAIGWRVHEQHSAKHGQVLPRAVRAQRSHDGALAAFADDRLRCQRPAAVERNARSPRDSLAKLGEFNPDNSRQPFTSRPPGRILDNEVGQPHRFCDMDVLPTNRSSRVSLSLHFTSGVQRSMAFLLHLSGTQSTASTPLSIRPRNWIVHPTGLHRAFQPARCSRPERHFHDSFITARLAMARVIATWLPRCPCCHRSSPQFPSRPLAGIPIHFSGP